MSQPRDAYQTLFARANSRLADLSEERCREIEMAQTKALRAGSRGNAMLRELLQQMRDEPPSEAWRSRVHHSMRRLHVAMLKGGAPAETYQTAVNAYLDGQTELAGRFFTAEILLRPFGEH